MFKIIFILLLEFTLFASVEPSIGVSNETTASEKETKKTSSIAVAPILAYEPTYRFVAGGACFYEGENASLGLDSYTNFNQVYQVHFKVRHQFIRPWQYSFYLTGIKGFDSYTGEGGETLLSNRVQLWGTRTVNDFALSYAVSEMLRFEWVSVFRTREEESHDDANWIQRFPDEKTGGTGLAAHIYTTTKSDPTDGFKFRTSILYFPKQLTTLTNREDFFQVTGSLIVYKQILEELSPEIVAAVRLEAGTSFGTPSYMYKFRLGGSDGISGYQDNRFRGNKYYAQLTEVRYPIWKFLSGAFSLAFGDTTDDAFTNPKLSYGAGIRLGLPPDWVSKVRIDVAYGRDESGIFVNFGQAF